MSLDVFLLGPDQWDDHVTVQAPLWVRQYLGHTPDPFTPKDLRLVAAARLQSMSEGAIRGVIMDPKEQRHGEDHLAFFSRLEREHDVKAYFIVLPLQAKLIGTLWEGAMLSRDKLHGLDPHVAVFIQEGLATENEDGIISVDTPAAKGKRAQYLGDFLNYYANHVQLWPTFEVLVDLMERRGRILLGDHGTPPT